MPKRGAAITAAVAVAVGCCLYGHFRLEVGDGPSLQLATLRHDAVTFFTRNVDGRVRVRLAPSVDLFNESSFEGAWHRALEDTDTVRPSHCYTYRGGETALYGAFCTPPPPDQPTPSFRAFFGSCIAVSIPPLHRIRALEWAYQELRPSLVLLLGDLVYTDVNEVLLPGWRVPASLAWRRTWP
jgi:hypothetical protein